MTHKQTKERALREMVIEGHTKLEERLLERVIEKWDEVGEGCFSEFLKREFPGCWLEEVGKN